MTKTAAKSRYRISDITFKNILDTNEKTMEEVRLWRNKTRIRHFMFTRHVINRKEHLQWLAKLAEGDSNILWVVFVRKVPIGIVSLQNINHQTLSAEWGFYIGEDEYLGKGLSKMMMYKFLSYYFEDMKFNILIANVFSRNQLALTIHRKIGFILESVQDVDDKNRIFNFTLDIKRWKIEKARKGS